MIPRLLEKYRKEAIPAVMQKFNFKNPFQVPRIKKVVINMGVGLGAHDSKIVEEAQKDLTAIAGQKAVITKAKKAISNFKIRKGSMVGCVVTLRGARMYEFLDKLINVAIPRIRDFRGLSGNSFDEHGNYTFGLSEQGIFLEIEADKISRVQGMSITITMTKSTKEVAYVLLKVLGMPFRER
ncbi:MAG: 50S ribosomal protein L5 [Candidatus Omnitrophota bacterium]